MSQHTEWMQRREAQARRRAREARQAYQRLTLAFLALASLLVLFYAIGGRP